MDKRASEWVYCSKKNFKLMKKILFRLLFLTLIILPIVSLIHPGLPLTHDGQDHVVRIANFYQNLTEGNIIPRWAGNLNWGYGHPILEFLYPLPSYIASIFHFIGFSFVDSVKIVFALGMILSFFFMYLWLSSFLSKSASLFGAVLYTYAPYRFVELYVRGDIGENLAFAFVPLVLYFVYKIYKSNKFIDAVFGSISFALLILAHNAISLMLMPFIFIYCLYLIYLSKFNKYFILNTLYLILIGFSLSAFFWIPGLFEGKYTLRNIVTKGVYVSSFVTIKNLIYGPWNYGISGQFTVQFGPFQWIALIFSPFLLLKFKKNKKKLYLCMFLIVYSIAAIFLMLPVSNFIWSRIILLQNFQFTWRFLAIIVFSTSALGALVFDALPKKIKQKTFLISILTILLISSNYWKPESYLYRSYDFSTGVYKGTTDTGESAPVWSVRFMEKSPNASLEVVDGDAIVKELERKTTFHEYKIDVNKNTLFRENTLYFPGWEIKANGKPLNVQFQNMNYRGIMLFSLPPGSYNIEVAYEETKLRLLADVISLVSFGNVIGGIIFIFLIRYKFKKKL